MSYICRVNTYFIILMRKILLALVGLVGSIQLALATDCPSATVIPGFPTMPYTQTLVCGGTNDITSSNVPNICGSGSYYGGNESVYVWTPTASYTGVTIAYNGVSWSGIMLYQGCPTSGGTCIGNAQGSGTSKTLTVAGTITAGTTYYIMFDTWPTPNDPCGGIATFTLNGNPVLPSTPPTPTEAAGPPTCSAGTTIDLAGPPPAGVNWYWQTSATGTSTANLYTGPYTIMANGTYYARAFDTGTSLWSASSSSITVTDFPTATAPPAPTAAQNPACVTSGTDLTMPTAPAGYIYYWQGTVVNGSSTAQDASSPYHVSTSGTYNVAAYETATGCWSNTTSLAVTIGTYIPAAPTTTQNNFNICSGTMSQMIDATPPAGGSGGSVNLSFGTNLASSGTGAATFPVSVPVIPADATITSAQLQFTNVNSINGSWRSEIRVALGGGFTWAPTQISTLSSSGTITPDPVINLTGFTPAASGSTINLLLTETYDDGGAGVTDATFGEVKLVIVYTQNPVSTLNWYSASTGGTNMGSSSPFETVGTVVMPNTNSAGSFVFYAESQSQGCASTTRTPITVNVTEVLATLNPVNVTCNGGNNGSFTLGTVQCGTGPFLYSVNGGPFAAIPTNLTAGTYSIVMQDQANMGTSAPISITLTEPGILTGLNATNVTYFNATLGWTTTGNESTWTIIYGPAGFNPDNSGISVPNVSSNPYTLSGVLNANTSYDFYVFPTCGPVPDTAGPYNFATDPGFLAWDSQCGPGYVDISSTGTAVAGMTDDSEFGLTLPWNWNINGTTVSTITIGNNGGVLFNTLTGNVGYTATGNGMFPFAQDLNTANASGGVFYQSLGTAPNRQFVIMWKDLSHYTFPAATDGSTFEVLVDEASGDVYYYYNDVMMSNTSWDNGADAEIAMITPNGTATVSTNDPTYLASNSCVHFYNALCPNITNFASIIYANDAILSWDAGLYGEGNWTLVYGPAGFDPSVPGEAIDTFDLSVNSTDFAGTLNQLTSYDVYIYSECQADNLTSDGYFYNFTTLPFCSNPSAFTGMTDVDSLELTWNWVSSDPVNYPVTAFNIQYGMNGVTPFMDVANGLNNADTIFNANLIAGGVYQVYIQAECANTNDTSAWVGPITLIMPLSNDSVCGAENLALGTAYTFNNVGATVSTDEINIAPPATGAQTTTGWANSTLNNTTWFTFVAPASGAVRINNTAVTYDGQSAVYTVADCGDFNSNFLLVAANDNEIGGTSVAPNYTICGLTAGNTYYIMHDGTGTTGNYNIMITPIVLQAGSANALTKICTGSSIDLFTTINGNDANGVWSAPVAAANASISGSTFNSTGLGYNVFNFQYRMTDGCAYDSIVSQVQVYGPSNAGTNGTLTVCKNEPVDLLSGLSGTVDVDGTWYDPSHNALAGSSIHASQFQGSFNYDYVTGNGVCPNDSSQVTVIVLNSCDFLSVDEAVFEGVQLYPNPTTGIINIDADKEFTVNVTDANGRKVKADFNSTIGTTTIDLSKVQVGVYLVTLTNESASKVFRVVVQ